MQSLPEPLVCRQAFWSLNPQMQQLHTALAERLPQMPAELRGGGGLIGYTEALGQCRQIHLLWGDE